MKTRTLFLLLAALALLGAAPRASARDGVSFNFFYDSLEPYGEWDEVSDYGYCWRPTGVDADWSPYTDGYWAYTDDGWTWVSYENFGGITYHYGRWTRLEDEGWCWVPDYEWAPAWVSWRHSDDYVGWAPLPPAARFRSGIGFGVWVDTEYDIGPAYYSFCAVRDFGAPALRPVIIDRSRNVTMINNTVNITNITVNRGRNIVYTGGPNYATLAARSARPIPRLKLVRQTDPGAIKAAGGKLLAKQQGNQLLMVAPQVEQGGGKAKPSKIAKTISAPKVDKGWSGVKDPEARQKLQAQIKEQTKGLTPEKAPAKAIAPEDFKIVNEKGEKTPAGEAGSQSENGRGNSAGKGRKGKGEAGATTENATDQGVEKNAANADTTGAGLRGKKGKGGNNAEGGLHPFIGSTETDQPTEKAEGQTGKKSKLERKTDTVPDTEGKQNRFDNAGKQQRIREQQDAVNERAIHQKALQQQQLMESQRLQNARKEEAARALEDRRGGGGGGGAAAGGGGGQGQFQRPGARAVVGPGGGGGAGGGAAQADKDKKGKKKAKQDQDQPE